MNFHIISIFPDIFDSYFSESIIGKAKEKGLINVNVYNLRDYTEDKHRTVDDTPYGGGAGMVMKVEPLYRAVEDIKKKIGKDKKIRVILFAAKGQTYTQSDSKKFTEYDDIIFICGRYEGIDERVIENIADEEISIGNYVLTGGELPAMILVDSISRHIPGVLGNPESLSEESHSEIGLEYPQYTKPEKFNDWKVPGVLLSGNHQEIEKWRKENTK
ncbi:tRNA (guanosine(37)-N1)-methyltransferase TrmD [Patescibacteria group bacterium]